MAKVVMKDDVALIIEAKNIGFLKGLRDTVIANELEGLEELTEEAAKDAMDNVPEGYCIESIQTQVFGGATANVLVTVTARKKALE